MERTKTFLPGGIFLLYTLFLCLVGGLLYALIEIAWRGQTHPSMVVLGGICFCLLASLQRSRLPFFGKMLCGALIITILEYCFGIIVNIVLKQNVWDYSNRPFSLHGQICLQYSFYWLLLTVPAFLLSALSDRIFFSLLLANEKRR